MRFHSYQEVKESVTVLVVLLYFLQKNSDYLPLNLSNKLVVKHLLCSSLQASSSLSDLLTTAQGRLSELRWARPRDYRSVYVCYEQESCHQVRKFLPGWHHYLHYSCGNRHSYTLLSACIYCRTHSQCVCVCVECNDIPGFIIALLAIGWLKYKHWCGTVCLADGHVLMSGCIRLCGGIKIKSSIWPGQCSLDTGTRHKWLSGKCVYVCVCVCHIWQLCTCYDIHRQDFRTPEDDGIVIHKLKHTLIQHQSLTLSHTQTHAHTHTHTLILSILNQTVALLLCNSFIFISKRFPKA